MAKRADDDHPPGLPPKNDTLQLGSAMPPCFGPSMDGKGTQDHVELDLIWFDCRYHWTLFKTVERVLTSVAHSIGQNHGCMQMYASLTGSKSYISCSSTFFICAQCLNDVPQSCPSKSTGPQHMLKQVATRADGECWARASIYTAVYDFQACVGWKMKQQSVLETLKKKVFSLHVVFLLYCTQYSFMEPYFSWILRVLDFARQIIRLMSLAGSSVCGKFRTLKCLASKVQALHSVAGWGRFFDGFLHLEMCLHPIKNVRSPLPTVLATRIGDFRDNFWCGFLHFLHLPAGRTQQKPDLNLRMTGPRKLRGRDGSDGSLFSDRL